MKRILTLGFAAVLISVVVASACGDDEEEQQVATPTAEQLATPTAAPEAAITIKDAWARNSPAAANGMGGEMPAGDRGAAYMIIVNASSEPDALIGAQSDVSTATEIHESIMEGDVVKMQKVDRIDVPANGQAELKPGGYHVMFIDLKQPLVVGETIDIVLQFEKAGSVPVKVTVREQ